MDGDMVVVVPPPDDPEGDPEGDGDEEDPEGAPPPTEAPADADKTRDDGGGGEDIPYFTNRNRNRPAVNLLPVLTTTLPSDRPPYQVALSRLNKHLAALPSTWPPLKALGRLKQAAGLKRTCTTIKTFYRTIVSDINGSLSSQGPEGWPYNRVVVNKSW